MKQFFTFIHKEFLHVFRDSKTLLLLFGLPIAQILLFGFALTNEIKDSRIVILDNAKDAASQAITEKLMANPSFIVEKSFQNYRQISDAFQHGHVNLAVVFPANLEQDLNQTRRAAIQVVADASDPNIASALTNYVTMIVNGYTQKLNENTPYPLQIGLQTRMIYNPELKGSTNFVPGVMALVLSLICVLMTSVSIVREKEKGTMEILLVSPFQSLFVVFAKAVPYFFLALLNLTVILLLSVFVLDMQINGSLALLYFESSLLIFTALSLGLVVSNSTESQQAAMLISLMAMLLPTLMFTGFMFPVENMPKPLQIISNVVPSKWYYLIVKAVMIKGLGIEAIWKETLILAGMGILLFTISILKFKNRLE